MTIKIRAIIEILGKPEEHIKKTMDLLVAQIEGEKNFKLLKKHISETEKQEEMFSIFTEVELEFENIEVVMAFTFAYMPSVIEFLEPDQLNLSARDLTNFFTDLQTRLHNSDAMVKVANQKNKLLLNQVNVLAKNSIIVTLRLARDKGMKVNDIAMISGIAPESLTGLLEVLEKENKIIKKDNDLYMINFNYKGKEDKKDE